MDPLQIRRALAGEISRDGRKLRGFIPYNSPATILERGKLFTEVIRPGAFARSLAAAGDVVATFNHDLGKFLGRTSSGTLTITDGPDGLRYSAELPDSRADVRELLDRGDLRGSSFTAFPHKNGDRWTPTPGKATPEFRELLSLELVELGPVINPAYTGSGAEMRSAGEIPPAGRSRLAAALVGLMLRT